MTSVFVLQKAAELERPGDRPGKRAEERREDEGDQDEDRDRDSDWSKARFGHFVTSSCSYGDRRGEDWPACRRLRHFGCSISWPLHSSTRRSPLSSRRRAINWHSWAVDPATRGRVLFAPVTGACLG